MTNGWTGGQYSLYRMIFGLCLLVRFVGLDTSGWSVGLIVAAVGLSVAFAAGYRDRLAAALLAGCWIVVGGWDPLIVALLLAHLFLPASPFGSWTARGRADAGGGWQMSGTVFAVAWIVLASAYVYSGVIKLQDPTWFDGRNAHSELFRDLIAAFPEGLIRYFTWAAPGLELAFAPLALFRRLRPWVWLFGLIAQLKLMLVFDLAVPGMGLVLLHGFTFDPAWIRPMRVGGEDTLFYDGSCGLCHASVRAVLVEDRSGAAFKFAPLGGARFLSLLPAEQRRDLPDSLVVRSLDGTILTRSRAVFYIGKRLGGIWRVVSTIFGAIPSSLSDLLYDGIAAIRHRLFRRPAEACPVLPPSLRGRFED